MKKQLTVRGLGEDLASAVQRLAAREQISLNQAALKLLRQGAGLSAPFEPPNAPRRPIEDLFGAWNREDAATVECAISVFAEIEPELWK